MSGQSTVNTPVFGDRRPVSGSRRRLNEACVAVLERLLLRLSACCYDALGRFNRESAR